MFLATSVTALALFLPYLLDVNSYREEILAALKKSLNRPVSFSSGSFAWHFGPSFDFYNVSVLEPDGTQKFLSAKKITVQLALLPLLEKQIELKSLHIDGAGIALSRYADGRLNIDDLLKPEGESSQINFKKIHIINSTFMWRDLAGQKGEVTATATNVFLTADHLSRGKKGRIKLSADILPLSGATSHVSLSGSVRLPTADKPIGATELICDAELKQIEIGRVWHYVGRFIPFANPGGRITWATSFKGTLSEFTATGKIGFSGISVYWPTVFHATLAPRTLQLEYSLKLNDRLIDISTVDARTDGFRIKGTFQMFDYRTADPRIVAKASTPGTFRYEEIRNFIPYGIIEKDASDYVENKIKSGIFKLDTGILDGRISQIAHMEIGQNYNVLTIRGPVEKAVLSYGSKAPTFNNLKGTIELMGKNFNLIGMSGSFGTSPFTLDGSITEYNTHNQSSYPVRMDITPQAPEVAWLAKMVGLTKLEYANSSILKLNGSGHHSAYRLNGEWDLKQAAYAVPSIIRKPTGRTNSLTFSSIIGKDETKLTALSYFLQPFSLSGNAIFNYAAEPYLGFNLQTNRFLMNETLPILPVWQHFHPVGTAQASMKGSGNPSDFSSMTYNGSVSLANFSVSPGAKLQHLSGMNGTITLRGTSMETSRISARYGSSPVTFSAAIKNLHDPETDIQLSSPQFYLRDINLTSKRPDASIKRLNAAGSVKNGSYNFKSISGLFNESNFSISGAYQGGQTPSASLAVTSTKMDLDDVLNLSSPKSATGEAASASTDIKLKLNVAAGTYGNLPFKALKAVAQRDNSTIYLQSLAADVVGGKLTATGRIAQAQEQGNRYDVTLDLTGGDAEKLFTILEVSREVTGNVTIHGNLTARGNNLIEVKKSALGNIRLQMSKGKLRKFSMLSKVFSILNVSQLLKFQLPDMVSNGMPYNSIIGSFAVKDGTIASQDLFISSDAINISVIGSADIVKEELNLTLGVQPLQTVDKIINRIPIIGWILTGKDKDLLTAYFEAKGTWAHPQVSAIPAKSLGKGVLNIFRRVFELPVRLFTDTGEVILGK
ncbi:MAG TPA: AsmA family protein [Desulfuromonadales bacterium]|nr:AsmA family protein [Desulfuromonadales bacterium]